jgi:GNAT superfamily N-acetyltransferase
MDHWFPSGWEDAFGKGGHTIVALRGSEIVGWADFRPDPKDGAFGPIGVLEAYRGHGIGTSLLLESMLRMRDLGTPRATAGWAVTGFYLRSGWEICRQYAPFQKRLY